MPDVGCRAARLPIEFKDVWAWPRHLLPILHIGCATHRCGFATRYDPGIRRAGGMGVVDTGTWHRLSADDQAEYRRHSPVFTRAVLGSGTADGWDFGHTYRIGSDGEYFFLTDGSGPFAGIRCRSRSVIEALLADAVQNYGR